MKIKSIQFKFLITVISAMLAITIFVGGLSIYEVDNFVQNQTENLIKTTCEKDATQINDIFGDDYKDVSDSNTIITAVASDVTNAYFYLLPGLIQLTKPCDPCDTEISPEIQRAFLILWSHLEAIRLERWKEAEMFYDLIKNNFQHCLGNFEIKQKSCNCHGQKQSNFNYRR